MELSAISEELTGHMSTIAESVAAISDATRAEATQVDHILKMIDDVSGRTDEVHALTDENAKQVDVLNNLIQKFKL
jgi:methyl-accepting chemotaxis protein